MNVLGNDSTLFVTIIIVAALAYLGGVVFQPARPAPRILAGYVCGGTALLIGLVGLYYGGSFEAPLVFQGVYIFDPLRMEWIALGVLAMFVGFLLVRQSFMRR